MTVLVTSATANEISPTLAWADRSGTNNDLSFLTTGIGGVMTATALCRALRDQRPALIIQAGIAGSYDPAWPPVTTVLVKEDLFADLGARENDGFSDMFDMGFIPYSEAPFHDRMLVNDGTGEYEKFGLPAVRGATVNRITSSPGEVSLIVNKYHPAIESMEGAALHYVCLVENIPFLQIRSVSNFAGVRNKKHWKIKEAIKDLNDHLIKILEDIFRAEVNGMTE